MNPSGKRRIALIDDSGASEPALAARLQREGCELLRTSGSAVDVDEMRRFSPDAILIDLAHGPGPDGLDTVRRLREESELNHVVIAGVTVPLPQSGVEAALSAGCDRLFIRPIDVDSIAEYVSSIDRRRHVDNNWPAERERRATMDRG